VQRKSYIVSVSLPVVIMALGGVDPMPMAPKAEPAFVLAQSAPPTNRVIDIGVDGEGRIYREDSVISLDQLRSNLQMIDLAENPTVFVKPHGAADFSKLLEVMSVIRESGFTNVSLVAGQRQ
jgi:biopolymer transport protein ExbD